MRIVLGHWARKRSPLSGPGERDNCPWSRRHAERGRWCTVSAFDEKGQRHSLDIRAESTYDAAHLYVSTAKSHAAAMLPSSMPVPTLTSVFEVVVDGKVYTVKGAALQRWIIKQRGGEEGTEGISIFAASDSRLSASQAFAFGFAAAFPSAAGTMPFL